MAIEFTELVRNFVPFGIGADAGAATENTLLEDLVGGRKSVLEVIRTETLSGGLAAHACDVDVINVTEFEAAEGVSAPVTGRPGYDVVVLSDVLAYVREPVRLLHQCRRLVSTGGSVIATMPNFAYGALRLALLSGAYDEFAQAQEVNPRLHFFTLELIERLLSRAGYRIEQTLRRTVPWESALNQARYDGLDDAVVRQIQRDPEHATLTFLIKFVPIVQAVPVHSARKEPPALLKSRLDSAEAELDAAQTLNVELREAGRALREQVTGLRRKARVSDQLQRALDGALADLAAAFVVQDDLLTQLHSTDASVNRLAAERDDLLSRLRATEVSVSGVCVERDDLLNRLQSAHAAVSRLTAERDELSRTASQKQAEAAAAIDAVKKQNTELVQRAQSAERTAVELAKDLLESTKSEIQQLSELIDTVQRSRFWDFKRFLARLRGLLIR